MSLTCCFCCSATKRREEGRERLYSSLPGMQMSIRKKQGIMTSQPCDSDENTCGDDVNGETSGCVASDTDCHGEKLNLKTKCNRESNQRYSLPFFMWDKRNNVKNDCEPEDTDRAETGTNRIEQLEHILTLPTSSTDFDLGYDIEVMKQKKCIALINNTLLNDGDCADADPESLKQCSALVRAVEIAAYEIYSNRGDCSRRDSTLIKTSLNEYKISELILSSVDRADTRRSGIAERCEVERNLVKLSLKYLMQHALMSL